MIRAFFLSLGQLLDGRIVWVMLKSLAVTLLIFAGIGLAIWYGAHQGAARLFGAGDGTDTLADILTLVVVLLPMLFLFRVVAIAVIDVFADDVVEVVEKRYYPAAHANARRLPLVQGMRLGAGSAGRAVLLNVLFSPVYLIALPAAPFVFFIVNSWLLGRELGDMVAIRHMPLSDLPKWRRRSNLRRFGLGAVGTALFLIPGIDLFAPVLCAAMATHVFHRRRG